VFLGAPFDNPQNLQKITLILNTVILIGALLAVEFIYSGASKKKKKQMRLFYPLAIVLAGLLAFAIYKQGAA
jgi:uncharacterized membrane protein